MNGRSIWAHARGELSLEQPRVMGIVNVTPDSFFDGGKLMPPEGDQPNVTVIERRAIQMLEDGASVIDVGGESTRPQSTPVPVDRELARVIPVLDRLCGPRAGPGALVSIDTRRAAVAREALSRGVAIVNDVSGLADPGMAEVVAEAGAGLVIGHLRGQPSTMQDDIAFDDLLGEVGDELAAAADRAISAGVGRERIMVDPCIGFGKTPEQSAALVVGAGVLRERTGCRVLIGASRKSFLGRLAGQPVEGRLIGSVVSAVVAAAAGASVIRAHDVRETVEGLAVSTGIARAFAAHARPRDR